VVAETVLLSEFAELVVRPRGRGEGRVTGGRIRILYLDEISGSTDTNKIYTHRHPAGT
jgi:hypothetical protein